MSNDAIDPKLFRQINELLARWIYSPDTSEAMKKAAKKARMDLHRLFGTNNNPACLHNMQTATPAGTVPAPNNAK